MKWKKYDKPGVRLLKERKYVLVQVAGTETQAPCVCVGYLRRWSNGNFFMVTPGVGIGDRPITHWSDCLSDDFNAPLWG